ncbi:MAG: 2,3,4,5-tetrahydropyridine-2,6-dicarboxylate N-succinyltransferase [Planctomycetota bacterium]
MTGEALLAALESGAARAARRAGDGGWVCDPAVKAGILELFATGAVVPQGEVSYLEFRDKHTLPARKRLGDVRVVPGGTSVRRGSHLGRGVVLMPPCYVNVGAFVGADSMIDSHALVGSCAQVGERVHVGAGALLGGVLEPVGARPVVVEDDAFIGGSVGLFEGVVIGARAVIAPGTILTSGTRVFDLVEERELDGQDIPPGAVVVPGTRPATGWGATQGLSLACALIVKYRDARTDAATTLEAALR